MGRCKKETFAAPATVESSYFFLCVSCGFSGWSLFCSVYFAVSCSLCVVSALALFICHRLRLRYIIEYDFSPMWSFCFLALPAGG
jgi:hypothetical protein